MNKEQYYVVSVFFLLFSFYVTFYHSTTLTDIMLQSPSSNFHYIVSSVIALLKMTLIPLAILFFFLGKYEDKKKR